MPLHPNLHLLLPSSTPGIHLETRLYLPPTTIETLSTSVRTKPVLLSDLPAAHTTIIRSLGIKKLVIGAHPWGRLGGNMLFPVLTVTADAIFASSAARTTAYATFNVRGVGQSGGSMPWPGCGIGHDGADFAEVEKSVLELVGGDAELYRLVSSLILLL